MAIIKTETKVELPPNKMAVVGMVSADPENSEILIILGDEKHKVMAWVGIEPDVLKEMVNSAIAALEC